MINIKSIVDDLGGMTRVALACDVSVMAVSKWCRVGRLPRTEGTGETEYAKIMAGMRGSRYTQTEILRACGFELLDMLAPKGKQQ